MRLIDADELKELFAETITYIGRKTNKIGALEHMIRASAMAIQMINDAPTVDAIPQWIPCSERLPEGEVFKGDDAKCVNWIDAD